MYFYRKLEDLGIGVVVFFPGRRALSQNCLCRCFSTAVVQHVTLSRGFSTKTYLKGITCNAATCWTSPSIELFMLFYFHPGPWYHRGWPWETFARGLARLRVRDTELMQDLAMEATGTIMTGVGLESSESFGEFMAKMAMELWMIFVDLLFFVFRKMIFHYWVVVSNIFYFHPYVGKISDLTI